MAITFAKAPLIELISELRWIPRGSTPQPTPAQQPGVFVGGVKQEEFYMQIGGEFYKTGFDRSERLFPAGLPFALHQPVFRFRSEKEGNTSIVYQVGYGIFSVHAVPPYHSWAKFVPFVREGIKALLKTRPESDRDQPFSQLSLRYIDFFNQELMGGKDIASFASDVLKISTKLPIAISKVAASNQVKSLFTKIVLPIGIGDLTVSVGDGKFNDQMGILLDNNVSSTVEVRPEVDATMSLFESAYSVLHNMFLELTEPIRDLMKPERGATS
jgi:uncharacterized protein (TIGR04255 family)